MKGVTIRTLQAMKRDGQRFCCVTAYDASFARTAAQAGIETILVGDSLGMVLQGHSSTIPVTIEDMAYHTRCVARGAAPALVIGDMPFMSYATPEQAMHSATALMQAGAQVVKLEGGAWLAATVNLLAERGVPVCAHLGLTPQSVNSFGGFVVQGRDPAAAQRIADDARTLADAGAALLVLECVPRALAVEITRTVSIPVIGIGAGAATDAQVLVMHDMLGMNPRAPRFVQNFMTDGRDIAGAFAAYAAAVRDGSFPRPEHGFD
ncbi:MAG: 3-methyl-2-oxobutanoate hydroxymethyltransferase [Pseudomonadales bacterium]|jgi:3-methyl-2-oxobutanoate hydroxymethyltransferase|nr:3-methyl-2-oxobutanoate hydroxymethyltransferase [Pseudomonadales bacterium]MCP5322019.1 3-methyl-2-oxobutanoate hydroxymethyltransferase [Pseudomonadales bacterium]MCP5338076.1 3-methyl-2-oxobutanoate hydroxymethyltransferase [Pseudomonadales bacterium]